MRSALVIYCFFLAVEAGLAWAVSGNPFLAAAMTCGLLTYAAVWKARGPWGEIVRALTAGLIAVAGPLYYKAFMLPTMLCFIALPHLLAATQCFWEIALGNDPAQQNQRMRTVVFTVAFYAAMGLVFLLLRGEETRVSRWVTGPLAILVLLAALPAWDLARVARLKSGRARAAPRSVLVRRIILLLAVLGMVAAVFTGVLPAAAEKLCAVSPHWRAKVDTPEKPRPHPPQPPPPSNGSATRPGMDSSAMTGRHQLPQKSNLQSLGIPQLHVRIKDKTTATRMANGTVYVRSHTLDAWKDDAGAWESSIAGGQWLADAADGAADGQITLKEPPLPPVEHTVFLDNADGYSLPALQGICAYRLPNVFAVPGDLFQMQATGNISYEAVSAPAVWDQFPDPAKLRAGRTGNPAQTKTPDSPALSSLIYGEAILRPNNKAKLSTRISGIRQWFKENIRYSTVMAGHESLPALDNFLAGERKGYCDFYASAACLMLRFSEVPTRVAYGYAGHDYDEAAGVFTFTDDSAHAWTEIFLENYGWTVCDFTPPENLGSLKGTPPAKPEFKENAYEPVQPKKPDAAPDKEPDEFPVTSRWNDMVEKALAMKPMELTKEAVKWFALLCIAALLLRWLWKKGVKAKGDEEDAFAADEHQPPYFAEFLRVFCEAGCPRAGGSTPREYFTTLNSRGLAGPEFAPMISYHYHCRYADAGRDGDQEAAWLTLARETGERLQQSRSQS